MFETHCFHGVEFGQECGECDELKARVTSTIARKQKQDSEREAFIERAAIAAMQIVDLEDGYEATAHYCVRYATALYNEIQKERSK